jgi:hypothetical protein
MLELLLKVLDRLIDLVKYRGERVRRIFDEIFDPTFRDLEAIHKDYCAMFEQVLGELPMPDELGTPEARRALLAAAEKLRLRRLEFEPVRVKVAAVARETLGGRFAGTRKVVFAPEADAFLRAVVDYFPSGYVQGGSATSDATSLMVALRMSANPIAPAEIERHGDTLSAMVSATLLESRGRWRIVCDRYAALRAAVAGTD